MAGLSRSGKSPRTNERRPGCSKIPDIPLYTVFENLQEGATVAEIANWFQGLTEDQINQVLEHQARMLREDRIE